MERTMTIRPTEDRVLIRRAEVRERTEGGLFIPETAQHERFEGTVVAVGPGRWLKNGTRRPPAVKPGDRVRYIFGKLGWVELNIENEKMLLVREDEILGTLEAA
jgi:chaperonin GroES